MTDPILIPLDGSPLAEQALPLGVSIAKQLDSPLILLRVVPPPARIKLLVRDTEYAVHDITDPLHAQADGYLRDMTTAIREIGVSVATRTVEGATAEAIVDTANTQEASHIVMTTHGRSGVARWALGSVADRVLRLAPCPIILFRPQEAQPLNLTELPAYRRILVPLDGSQIAEQILPHVTRLAGAYDAELILYRVLLHPPPHLPEPQASTVLSAYEQTVGREAREYLADLVVQLAADGITATPDVGGEPITEAILTHAREAKVDMIAMTSHARMGLSRTILGSVTDRVIRAGQVPVLVTKP